MTATIFADDLIREYLLFRGFISTSKAFEAELKIDRDKGFRADKIVDQLCSYISSFDLLSLREAWTHLDQRIFARLEHSFMATVRKLENSLLKMYVVNTIQTNRQDKLLEFFERTSQELQNQSEWKEWFILPFIKNPEENPTFQVYFTRQWQDTMLVSLHNFLSVIFQSMILPTLMSYEEEQNKIGQLQEENEKLKNQITVWQMKEQHNSCRITSEISESDVPPISSELMDDFYVIAHREAPSSDGQLKSIRSIIKNISSGLPTSPILGRRPSTSHSSSRKTAEEGLGAKSSLSRMKSKANSQGVGSSSKSKIPSESDGISRRVHIQSKEEVTASKDMADSSTSKKDTSLIELDIKTTVEPTYKTRLAERHDKSSPLILLSQEEYGEHQSAITHCKFNASGTLIASSDADGVIKVWSPSPTPRTLATVISKSSILALEWAHKKERLLLLGNKTGIIRLYDTKEKKTLCEVGIDSNNPTKDHRIMCLAGSPTGTVFATGCSSRIRSSVSSDKASNPTAIGRLLLWDMKAMKLDKCLNLKSANSVVNCCAFNHNGQLLVVGTADGQVHLFDMQRHECINQWQAHHDDVYSVQFSVDETSCYSMGKDNRFIQWSINQTGKKICEYKLHEHCAGPFSLPASQASPANTYHHPFGKLFTFDTEGNHVLACADNAGAIYRSSPNEEATMLLQLGGHRAPVITMDWTMTMDCGTCITASLDGKIRVSTLLAQ